MGLHIWWDWDYKSLQEEMARSRPRGVEILSSIRTRLSSDLEWPAQVLLGAIRNVDGCQRLAKEEYAFKYR